MNKIAIILDANGEISGILSNELVEVYMISNATMRDRVYQFSTAGIEISSGGIVERTGVVTVAPGAVEEAIGDSPIGNQHDGMLDLRS
jgi:hypothetical protein